MHEKEKKSIKNLDGIPQSIKDLILFQFISPEDISILSNCSSTLYRETKNITYWKDKLIKIGLNPYRLKKLLDANVVQNYKTLYRNLLRLIYKFRTHISVWELLCLSGEIAAIHYAVQKEGLTKNTKGICNRNALHYASLSGSVPAMREAIKLGLSPTSIDKYGVSVLDFAAWSGSVKAMREAIKLGLLPRNDTGCANPLHFAAWGGSIETMHEAIQLGISPTSTELNGRNTLHNAALGGSISAMRKAIELGVSATSTSGNGANAFLYAAKNGSVGAMREAIKLGLSPTTSTISFGINALHYAAWGGSSEAIRETIKLGLEPTSVDNCSANALHYAALSGSVEAIRETIKLGLLLTSIERNGVNVLHNAAWSGSVEAVLFIRRLSYEFDLKLEPTVKNSFGEDAFNYADRSENAAEIKKILSLSKEELNLPLEASFYEKENKPEQLAHKSKCLIM